MRQQCSSACAFSAQVQCPAEMGIVAQAILHPTITFTHYAQRYMQQQVWSNYMHNANTSLGSQIYLNVKPSSGTSGCRPPCMHQ